MAITSVPPGSGPAGALIAQAKGLVSQAMLMAAAAAFLGGTALAGGRGSVLSSLLATILLSTPSYALNLAEVMVERLFGQAAPRPAAVETVVTAPSAAQARRT